MYRLIEFPDFYKNYDLDKLTKGELAANLDLVIGLSLYNWEFGKHSLAQNVEVLKLCDGDVAGYLAFRSKENGWGMTKIAQNFEILSLCDGAVASLLASDSGENGWAQTPAAQKLEVLKLSSGNVAEWLAKGVPENGWGETPAAQDKRVLELCDGEIGRIISSMGKNKTNDEFEGVSL